MIWRFIELKELDPLMAIALEEVGLEYVQRTNNPIIRFWRWNKKAVSIGRFQTLQDEVNIDKCNTEKILMLRRLSGGGAVFNSPGEIVYSVIAPYTVIPKDIGISYTHIFSWIIEGLKDIGINSYIESQSNINVNGKKISGNCKLNKIDVSMQHGTILYEVDESDIFSYLTVHTTGASGGTKSIYRPITCIKNHKDISYFDAYTKIKNAFLNDKKFEVSNWTPDEMKMAEELIEKKYKKNEWTFTQG
ncbi:MAG TPA: biotin/lipoate A/B protein ligase family protein [Methanofastidiosum sp.]|nr:biotin/lipoate A/B protein ligase family protein [Methanofastidiosum sp.]HNU61597.1 biotin/lipoate A/B protein ligase family protein [Methanofastidiosum sp.]HOI77391.1 biotin/lipoate A/B protein ligase family protein [Methanofastidiosum sp.]